MSRLHVLLFLLLTACLGASTVLDNQSIIPETGSAIRPDVMGRVLILDRDTPLFGQPTPGRHAEVWDGFPVSLTGGGTEGGILCNMDDDPELEIVHGFNTSVKVFNSDGSVMTGWPQTTQYVVSGAPPAGDLDGDGELELVISTHNLGSQNNGMLYAFEKDGSALPGFPVTMDGGGTNTPTVVDINGDGLCEIAIGCRHYPAGYLCVFDHTGSAVTGFPVTLDYVPASPVAVGDINGDDIPELVLESYYSLYAVNNQGSILAGFPFTPGNGRVFSYSTPVLVDLDNDGGREIVFGDHNGDTGDGRVHILRNNGSIFPGWPQTTSSWVYSPPSIGDIDEDGALEIFAGDQVMSGSPADYVYGWETDGTPVDGFPIGPVWSVNAQIMLVDIDNDNLPELITDDNTADGLYPAYNGDGTEVDGWDVTVTGSSFYQTPSFADVDGDGELDMTGIGYDLNTGNSQLYLWDLNTPVNTGANILVMNQYDLGHSGVYVAPTNPPEDHHYGDVDDNGTVDETDAQLVLEYSTGGDPLTEDPRPWEDWRLERADLDGNGRIQAYDAASILRHIAGNISLYPVEDSTYIAPIGHLTLNYTSGDSAIYMNATDSLYALNISLLNSLMFSAWFVDLQLSVIDSYASDSLFLATASEEPLVGEIGGVHVDVPLDCRELVTFHITANDLESEVIIDFNVANDDSMAESTVISLPNPFRPGMTMQFGIEHPSYDFRAELYNIRGQQVRTLLAGEQTAGTHLVSWNGCDRNGSRVATGVYFLRVQNGAQTFTRKLLLLR